MKSPLIPIIKTSATDPLRVGWVAPRLGFTFAPGKHGPGMSGVHWERDLDADLSALAVEDCVDLISLVEDWELSALAIPNLVERAREHGITVHRVPIPDGGVPTSAQVKQLVSLVRKFRKSLGRTVVHCKGGLGRAGTVAAFFLMADGISAEEAIRMVRAARPGAVETDIQEEFLHSLEKSVFAPSFW